MGLLHFLTSTLSYGMLTLLDWLLTTEPVVSCIALL